MTTYGDMVRALGLRVGTEEAIGNYQGDLLFYVAPDFWRSEEKRGFLVVGYGSCSGCDSLEAAETTDDCLEIMQGIAKNIRWFPTHAEALAWLEDQKATEYQWYGHEKVWPAFVEKVKALPADSYFWADAA